MHLRSNKLDTVELNSINPLFTMIQSDGRARFVAGTGFTRPVLRGSGRKHGEAGEQHRGETSYKFHCTLVQNRAQKTKTTTFANIERTL